MNRLITETKLQFVTLVFLPTCITSYWKKCKEHMCMLHREVIQDEVQYWICIPSTVQMQAFHHINMISFVFLLICISGYNDATDLSLGNTTDRMRNQGKKKREWSSAQSEMSKDLNLVGFLIKLDEQHMMPCAILIFQRLMLHMIFQQLSFIEFPA